MQITVLASGMSSSIDIRQRAIALIEIIERRLPESEKMRLDELRDRNEWEQLNDAEYQELIRYEDMLEQQRAERLSAFMELAKLRDKKEFWSVGHSMPGSASL